MVIALIIGSADGIAPLSQAFADVVTQEAEEFEAGISVEVADDKFTLKTLLNSKVLTLVPVYKANYICNLAEGSDVGISADIRNHVDMYKFAQTGSEAAASESMKFFHDDYDESLEIVVSTFDSKNIMFKGTAP